MRGLLVALVLLGMTVGSVQAQQGPDQAPSLRQGRSPRGALRRAALVPGWGQVYNRQWLKVPVLYAGIGLFVASAISADSDYQLYRKAFQYKAWDERLGEGELNPAEGFKSQYDQLDASFPGIGAVALERRRDNFRRNRDLSFVGIGAFWALGMLDAYVSAHLSDFDYRREPDTSGPSAR